MAKKKPTKRTDETTNNWRQKAREKILQHLTTLRGNGGDVVIRAGRLQIIGEPAAVTVRAMLGLFERERHVVEILRETKCQHCGQRLDDHEIGYKPMCFSCFLSDDHFTELTGRS